MPATPARIGFITQEFRRSAVENPAVKTRHGSKARKSDDPVVTYFDSAANALTVATTRQALLGGERRRFRSVIGGASVGFGLSYVGAVPEVRYVDAERGADQSALVAEIVIDLNRDTSTLMLWG
jgi:hypothetical protein